MLSRSRDLSVSRLALGPMFLEPGPDGLNASFEVNLVGLAVRKALLPLARLAGALHPAAILNPRPEKANGWPNNGSGYGAVLGLEEEFWFA